MNKRLVVVFEKRQCECERGKHRRNNEGDVPREDFDSEVDEARSPREVCKLSERKGAEHFVFDVDELRDFELHGYSIASLKL